VVKVELFMLPLMLTASFIFWAFFWHTSQIPSSQHPFASKVWPIRATFQAMFNAINRKHGGYDLGEGRDQLPAHRGGYGGRPADVRPVHACSSCRHSSSTASSAASAAFPQDTLATFIGAWLGRSTFQKRFGLENWRMYTPVLLAGFCLRHGLIAMASIALALIAKSVNYLPF
jgi:hypothetical protein